MPQITSSVAFLGLLRLCAAFWLTSDFSYTSTAEDIKHSSSLMLVWNWAVSLDSLQLLHIDQLAAVASPLQGTDAWFRSTSLLSKVFRTIFIAFFSGGCIIGVLLSFVSIPGRIPSPLSTTSLLGLFTTLYSGVLAVLLYTYHSTRHGCRSTMIPRINSPWYKAVCGLYFILLAILLILSAIETRRTPCGTYTTSRAGRWITLGVVLGWFTSLRPIRLDTLDWLAGHS